MYGDKPEEVKLFEDKLKEHGFTNRNIERLYFLKEKIQKYQNEVDSIFEKVRRKNKK